jgi:NADPH:quinone reductase-like Zn-dependent oxidoreductase
MKAITYPQHGGVEVLRYEDVPDPKPEPHEVLIKVRATGLNHNDLWARRGLPGMKFPLPHIPGSDVAGEVIGKGDRVQSVEIGQKVVIHPAISCRICAACTSGHEYFCRQFKIYGFQTGPLNGGYAEMIRIPEANVIPKPERLSWEEAATLPLCLLTVWHMLITRAKMQPGQDILVWGAGSGIGSIAIQLAKAMHCRVIATASSEEKARRAKELGADEVVDPYKQDVVAEVKKFTNKKGVEIVFEHTGEKTWERSMASLTWGGTIVICGNTTGFDAKTDLRFLFSKQLNLLGSHQGNKAELVEAMKLVDRGVIRPVLDSAFPLKDAAKAQQRMEESKHFGGLVLVP